MCGSLCVQACCVSVFESVVCVCGSLYVQVRERDVNDKLRVKELCVQVCVKELCVCVVYQSVVCGSVYVFKFVCERSTVCLKDMCVQGCVFERCVCV